MSNPWGDAPDLWPDEKAYCQWLRSMGRKIWARHPIKHRFIKMHKVPVAQVREEDRPPKLNSRTRELCKCAMCGEYKTASQIEVDHIEQAGSFSTVEEWHVWMDRLLLIGFDGMRVLCKGCHKKVNLSQRFHCDIEEAELRQKLAAFRKLRVQQMRTMLVNLKVITPSDVHAKRECERLYEQFLRDKTAGE